VSFLRRGCLFSFEGVGFEEMLGSLGLADIFKMKFLMLSKIRPPNLYSILKI